MFSLKKIWKMWKKSFEMNSIILMVNQEVEGLCWRDQEVRKYFWMVEHKIEVEVRVFGVGRTRTLESSWWFEHINLGRREDVLCEVWPKRGIHVPYFW